mmetsp:Transcript_21116/g.58583  ORF Transcript_21116/g.58583 Transcript_21116/m.58583 type:complete len:682 (+) Transcript_21116:350-2395(+)
MGRLGRLFGGLVLLAAMAEAMSSAEGGALRLAAGSKAAPPPTPEPLHGYWQGMLEFGEARGWLKVEVAFGFGRRLVPPDTAADIEHRRAVVWETVSSQITGPGVGRFCEVLSFNSHAQVHVPEEALGTDSTTRAAVAAGAASPGEVCAIFNRTGGDLVVAWASVGNGVYPTSFEASPKTHVAHLRLLTTDLYPPELEGTWGGTQLLASREGKTVSQGGKAVSLSCSAGQCVYSGPAVKHKGIQESSVVATDMIFFQRAGEQKGKFCEFVTFSDHSHIVLPPGQSHGRLSHGTEVHCSVYRRVGDTLLVAWGSDPSGAPPASFRPDNHTVVATLELQQATPFLPEIQGTWQGHVRTREPGQGVVVERVQLSCVLSRCVSTSTSAGGEGRRGTTVFTALSGGTTGLGSGRLCELATGGTGAAVSGLNVTHSSVVSKAGEPLLLRATWDMLGKVRCAVYERRGDILKFELSPRGGAEEDDGLPPGFDTLPEKIASGTFVLQRGLGAAYATGEEGGGGGLAAAGRMGAESQGAFALDGSTSPLSMFIAAQGRPDDLPPPDVAVPRAFVPRKDKLGMHDAGHGGADQTKGPTLGDSYTSYQRVAHSGNNESLDKQSHTILDRLHQQLGLHSPHAGHWQQQQGQDKSSSDERRPDVSTVAPTFSGALSRRNWVAAAALLMMAAAALV